MGSKIEILIETFKEAKADIETVGERLAGIINGTIDIKINAKIVTAWADYTPGGRLYIYGFIGRYRTSVKPWRASVWTDINIFTHERVTRGWFGRDDRSARFNKMQGISWEPELYFTLTKESLLSVPK